MTLQRLISSIICAAGAALPIAVWAAHPLQTEDSSTQGSGNLEIENGLQHQSAEGFRAFQYQPQFSYGITPTFDFVVQPTWLSQTDDTGARSRGLGDTAVDFKWRFFGSDPYALAVRAGLGLNTAQHSLGLPRGQTAEHILLVGTIDVAPLTWHGNLAIAHNPGDPGQRTSIRHVSGAVMWQFNERLVLTVDAGAESDTDATRRQWPSTILAGLVYTLIPGLDFDIGYQSTVRASMPIHKVLVGLTYRFAP